jgi:hypothetical protein
LQLLGQPRLDLLGLLPGLTAHREIIGVSNQHRGARHRYPQWPCLKLIWAATRRLMCPVW